MPRTMRTLPGCLTLDRDPRIWNRLSETQYECSGGDPFEKMGGVLGEVSVFDWWEEALNKLNKELGAITVDARESSTGSDKKEVHATFVPKQHRVDDVE